MLLQVDYEADSVFSNKIDPKSSGGFIDGNFTSGKLKEIQTNAKCYILKFNLNSTLLAVGLSDGQGVELYETNQFRLIYTIERSDTVSALDWVEADAPGKSKLDDDSVKSNESEDQLLAVGSFDGFVKVYSISLVSKDVVTLVDSFHFQSGVYSIAFLKDNATNYAPSPRTIAVGERNGRVSIVTLAENNGLSYNNAVRIRVLDARAESAILSLAFGFVDEGIIMVYGTKDGEVRASFLALDFEQGWIVSHVLFELQRTGAIRALRFNHDSTTLIVGGYDKTVLIIDTKLWKIVRELYMDGTVSGREAPPIIILE